MIGSRLQAWFAGGMVGLALCIGGGLTRGQEPAGASLRVSGQVDTPVRLSATELAGMPRAKVQAADRGGVSAEYEGVPLVEILRKAGAPLGEKGRGGKATACYVVVEASDGYRAVFALAELDPDVSDKLVLLADRRDGRPMAEPVGPLRLIVPGDKRPARWVRMVESIAVQQAAAVETPR
ncbi:molybdopterin-dependent oxidoreductase [Paludisphaera rhizosphaerae]|uniref:molybdopterin-dependent oxidoreductase n=1 Tax=Paludisphaera rhizosphaerae TaxID=2711216 RepID=UPI0013ED5342|nr:molybdopterin-dependent oxidoreductase [Paludisphaera rhizosphaerae]